MQLFLTGIPSREIPSPPAIFFGPFTNSDKIVSVQNDRPLLIACLGPVLTALLYHSEAWSPDLIASNTGQYVSTAGKI